MEFHFYENSLKVLRRKDNLTAVQRKRAREEAGRLGSLQYFGLGPVVWRWRESRKINSYFGGRMNKTLEMNWWGKGELCFLILVLSNFE